MAQETTPLPLREGQGEGYSSTSVRKTRSGMLIIGRGNSVRAVSPFSGGRDRGIAYAEAVNRYYETFGDRMNIYCMVIPTAVAFYCPDEAQQWTQDQPDAVRHIYNHLAEKVIPITLFDTLQAHVQEPIYSRTDHHWAPLGAYYAARAFAAAAEVPFADLSTYKLPQAKADTANAYPVTTKGGKEIYAFNDRMQKAIDALDARLALNKKLSDELTKANNLIEDTEAKKDFEEYTELQAAYNANKDCDLINSLDDAINATYDAVHSAIYDYQFRVLRLQYATVRMHKLDSIAAKLGSDIVDNETVKAGLAAIEEDDPALAAIYISAIKIALYEKLDTDDAIYDEDSLDITPFISNYNLYQTPKILEKMDLQMPKNSGDMAKIGPNGENMLHTRHQYNENGNMPIWVIVPEQDITDLYPGWTVRAFRTGNTMVTGDKSYNNYKNEVPVFDGEIGMDWNCKAELKQDLANLPVGLYTLGVELPEIKNNGSDKVITLKGNDKSAVMNDKNATVGALTIDSIAVTDSLKIDLVVMSENGWSRADNFSLAFRPDKSFEYGDAITAEQAKLTELLTIVNSAKAVAANVEYFTLGGVQVAAPKAGQILIRKTTNANGKVVTDKVLLK